jgi:hypothetical protein
MIDILNQAEFNRIFDLIGKMVRVTQPLYEAPYTTRLIAISKDHAVFSNDRKIKWGIISSMEEAKDD